MYEDIVSFTEDSRKHYPFYIQMAGISYCDATYKIDRKNSDIYCFEYIIKGEGTIKINGQEFIARSGDIYILPRGCDHLYMSDVNDPWTKIWFNIKGPVIDNLMQAYKLNNIYHIKNLDLKELFYEMFATVKETNKNMEQIFQKTSIIFHEILLKIYSYVEIPQTINNETALQLKEYIDTNVESNLSIKTLANYVFRSPSQTIRIFKKEYEVTPYEYILSKRIETAKLLLINTNMPIKLIALKLKFADEHYFSNYFKLKTGSAPSSFRKNK